MKRRYGAIVLVLCLLFLPAGPCAEEIEFTFTNTYDGTKQPAVAYIPDSYTPGENRPLLVVAHYMGGNRFTARKSGYYPECDARGYLLVCPELHGRRTGGETSLASLEAQHDVVGAIEYMKEHYGVDASRIYIVGRSMGGMLSQVMAAKYPDLFAAAVSGQGISDLKLWYETAIPRLKENTVRECGPLNDETRFDYERRSSISYARNFRYVPLILWHGTNDTWVPPEQSEILVKEIRKYNRFQSDVHWLHCAAHCPANYSAEWVCDRLTYYQNVCEAGFGTSTRFFPELNIVTDEAKRFFWLGITPAKENAFARVEANLRNGTLFVRTKNVSDVVIDLNHVSKQTVFSRYDISGDTRLRLSIERNGNTVFEIETEKGKTGKLPRSFSGG